MFCKHELELEGSYWVLNGNIMCRSYEDGYRLLRYSCDTLKKKHLYICKKCKKKIWK